VHGKGGRESLLPLTADVGEAIAAYLEHGRHQPGSAPLPSVDGADPRVDGRIGRNWLDCALRAPAGRGRCAAPRLAPVPACLGCSHVAARRVGLRDRPGASPSQPAVHQHLRQWPGGAR
jgi:hypothetical protein